MYSFSSLLYVHVILVLYVLDLYVRVECSCCVVGNDTDDRFSRGTTFVSTEQRRREKRTWCHEKSDHPCRYQRGSLHTRHVRKDPKRIVQAVREGTKGDRGSKDDFIPPFQQTTRSCHRSTMRHPSSSIRRCRKTPTPSVCIFRSKT